MRQYIRNLKAQSAMALLAGALVVGGGAALFEKDALAKGEPRAIPVRLTVDDTPVQRDNQMVTSFSSVVKKVSPSVVMVKTTFKAPEGRAQFEAPFMDDPFFRRFFGDRFEGNGRNGMRPMPHPRQQGLGSGVIVTKDGYILTNNHVVDNADEVVVQLAESGDEFTARVVGTDPKSDIAVLKIDAKDRSFPALTAADS